MSAVRHPVTLHAVRRWLERCAGAASPLPASASEEAHVAYGLWLLDLSLAEARERILPARLRPFLELGASAVKGCDRTLVVQAGVVVTCLGAGVRTTGASTACRDDRSAGLRPSSS